MVTVRDEQAAGPRARGSRASPRKKPAAEAPAAGATAAQGRPVTGEAAGRARSTTGDLLNLVEQLSNFDRIGVTRLARHLDVPVPTAYRMLRGLERTGYGEQLAESKEYRVNIQLFQL